MIQLIDKIENGKTLENAVKRFKEKGIILPTKRYGPQPGTIAEAGHSILK